MGKEDHWAGGRNIPWTDISLLQDDHHSLTSRSDLLSPLVFSDCVGENERPMIKKKRAEPEAAVQTQFTLSQ